MMMAHKAIAKNEVNLL